MRRKIKRRLFLMSMTMATGASCPAFAKGLADAHFYTEDRPGAHITAYPDEVEHATGARLPDFLASMKNILGGLHYGAGSAPPPSEKGWRLELLPPEPRMNFDSDFRPEKARRVGLALRMAF